MINLKDYGNKSLIDIITEVFLDNHPGDNPEEVREAVMEGFKRAFMKSAHHEIMSLPSGSSIFPNDDLSSGATPITLEE